MKILVVRFSSLGDLVLMTPLLRELKKKFPDSSIDLVTAKEFAPLFDGNPHLSKIIPFDRKAEQSLWSLYQQLKLNGYSIVIDAHGSLRSRVLSVMLRLSIFKKVKVVQLRKRYRLRYLMSLPRWIRPDYLVKKYSSDSLPLRLAYLDILKKIDPKITGELDASTELFPSLQHEKEVEEVLSGWKGEWVAIAPSARHELKEWGVDKFTQLIASLPENIKPIIVGGAKDKSCLKLLDKHPEIPSLLGKQLLTCAAAIARCKATVSNDSANLHISEAMGIPVVAIFGSTVPELGYAPFLDRSHLLSVDLFCRPCTVTGKGKCRNTVYKKCMKDIPADRALEALKQARCASVASSK